MNGSSYKNQDYYPNSSRSQHSNRSFSSRKYGLTTSKLPNDKTKIQNRIQKACQYNSIEAYKKQTILLKKQIQRLEKENLKKDNHLFELKSSGAINKQLQNELEETYRIIYHYEGKIQELQIQLRRLQKIVSQKSQLSIEPQQLEELLNEYRNDNFQMRGKLEEQNRTIMELKDRIRVIQSKYFQTEWKLSQQNRIATDPLKKKFPKLRDAIVIQEISLSQRQKLLKEMEKRQQLSNNKYRQPQKDKKNSKQKDFQADNQFQLNRKESQHINNYNTSNSTNQTPIRNLDYRKYQNKEPAGLYSFMNINQDRLENNKLPSHRQQRVSKQYFGSSPSSNRDINPNYQRDSYSFYRSNHQQSNSKQGSGPEESSRATTYKHPLFSASTRSIK